MPLLCRLYSGPPPSPTWYVSVFLFAFLIAFDVITNTHFSLLYLVFFSLPKVYSIIFKSEKVNVHSKILLFVNFGIPVILTLLPLSTETYGSPETCNILQHQLSVIFSFINQLVSITLITDIFTASLFLLLSFYLVDDWCFIKERAPYSKSSTLVWSIFAFYGWLYLNIVLYFVLLCIALRHVFHMRRTMGDSITGSTLCFYTNDQLIN